MPTKRNQYVLHTRVQDLTDHTCEYLNAGGGDCGFPVSSRGENVEYGEVIGDNGVQVSKSEESPGTNFKSLTFSIV